MCTSMNNEDNTEERREKESEGRKSIWSAGRRIRIVGTVIALIVSILRKLSWGSTSSLIGVVSIALVLPWGIR